MTRKLPLLILVLGCLFASSQSFSRDLWVGKEDENGDQSDLKLSSAFKATGVVSAPSSDPVLSGHGPSSTGLGRLRLEPSYKTGPWMADAAYDNHLSYTSGMSQASSLAIPPYTPAPYRFWQVGGDVSSGNLSEAQELDRAFGAYQSKNLHLTAGRQAIGWGHGRLFSAVDIFAPFPPLVVDQEWRRGIDAFDADYKLTDTSSVEYVATGGTSWDQAAMGGRVRGFIGPVDGEILIAKRAQDMMYGVTSSAAVLGAEVHGEFALFETPGDVPSNGFLGDQNLIPKAVLGVSNNFNIGTGLQVGIEYHYSGFGAATASGITPLLENPNFISRLIRGDTQILGEQVLGIQSSYTFDEQWTASLIFLQSLIDASAVIAPSAVWDFSDSASLLGSVFVAYGATTQGGVYQSQFGGVPPSLILQLRIYD